MLALERFSGPQDPGEEKPSISQQLRLALSSPAVVRKKRGRAALKRRAWLLPQSIQHQRGSGATVSVRRYHEELRGGLLRRGWGLQEMQGCSSEG